MLYLIGRGSVVRVGGVGRRKAGKIISCPVALVLYRTPKRIYVFYRWRVWFVWGDGGIFLPIFPLIFLLGGVRGGLTPVCGAWRRNFFAKNLHLCKNTLRGSIENCPITK